MNITPAFAPSDKAWVILRGVVTRLTVGLVRVEIIDSPGVNGGVVDESTGIAFDNYREKHGRIEQYMMVETGVECGNVYTLGANCFRTETEAKATKEKLTHE